MEQEFFVGDLVNKRSGYRFPGVVIGALKTTSGEWRYVVEMRGYCLLHIFNGSQLVLEEATNG